LKFEADLPDIEPVARLVFRLLPDRFSSAKQPYPKGRFNLSGDFRGWWDRPDLSIAVRGSDVQYDQVSAGNFNLKGTFTGVSGDFKATAASRIENLTVSGNRLPRVDLGLHLKPDRALADLTLKHENGLSLATKGHMDGWRLPSKKITIETLRIIPADAHRGTASPGIGEVVNSGPIR
jgi:hypothetical protein